MRNICPKCLGMKKFYVGIPVPEKCEDHPAVNLIHVNNIIEIPADEAETDTQWPPKEETSLESALSVIPDMGVPILRSVAKKLEVKTWWMLSKKKLITKIKAALKAKYAG